MQSTSYGRRRDPEDLPCFGGVEPCPVHEDQRFPLRSREPIEGTADVLTCHSSGDLVQGLRGSQVQSSRHRLAASPLAVQVHRRSDEVAAWRVHQPDPVPSLEDPGERLLGEVLSVLTLGGHQEHHPAQRGVVGLEELLERRRGLVRGSELGSVLGLKHHVVETPHRPEVFGSRSPLLGVPSRGAVAEDVDPGAAIAIIRPIAAVEVVIARLSSELVILGVAVDGVVVGLAMPV